MLMAVVHGFPDSLPSANYYATATGKTAFYQTIYSFRRVYVRKKLNSGYFKGNIIFAQYKNIRISKYILILSKTSIVSSHLQFRRFFFFTGS